MCRHYSDGYYYYWLLLLLLLVIIVCSVYIYICAVILLHRYIFSFDKLSICYKGGKGECGN